MGGEEKKQQKHNFHAYSANRGYFRVWPESADRGGAYRKSLPFVNTLLVSGHVQSPQRRQRRPNCGEMTVLTRDSGKTGIHLTLFKGGRPFVMKTGSNTASIGQTKKRCAAREPLTALYLSSVADIYVYICLLGVNVN